MAELIAVARGDAAPDLVIEGGRVFSAFTREWLEGDVAISGGRIAGVGSFAPPTGERIDGRGRYVVPGFVDAHMHIESSKLTPAEFARAVVPHGVTTVVCDPHELANVLGADGVHWLIDASADVPINVYVMAPSCVPASAFESPRRSLDVGDMEAILRRRRTLGVAEMMNFPGVIAGDPDVLARIAARGASHVDGHAPGVRGRDLDAYASAGIRSDHESFTWEEALDKRRRGMWVLIREASNARNARALLELVRRYGPDYCAFCTDDREPDHLVRAGSIDDLCRIAVQEGVAAEAALVMASLHGARAHGLHDLGAIAPGYRADLLVLDDLESFGASVVVHDGAVVARDGVAEPFHSPPVPDWMRQTVHTAPLAEGDLDLGAANGPVRVIELVPEQIITGAGTVDPPVRDGHVVADPDRDLAKIAVLERHHATGRVGKGLVSGFGLRTGAFASTVAHDAHNLVVVGVGDADMAVCATRLAELGGGVAVARDGAVVAELALPGAGLLSDQPVDAVVAALDECHARLREQGVTGDAPFMTLSFLALSVIPSLKITDRGLVDVERFQIVGLGVDE